MQLEFCRACQATRPPFQGASFCPQCGEHRAYDAPEQPVAQIISRAEFRRDPDAAIRRAMVEGRVEIVDEHGRPVAAISVPEDQRDVVE